MTFEDLRPEIMPNRTSIRMRTNVEIQCLSRSVLSMIMRAIQEVSEPKELPFLAEEPGNIHAFCK
ncbi:hypothetical protein EG328_003757 [Venturia inaequalis]|uniref:Uncharacterized protein n=1 Tax=Venturia inaequalis TaxID=5025 RepID=A0A8H3UTN7_VENIN|nr:hypothetical protein EG328_003757 [Venturia inaequalis]